MANPSQNDNPLLPQLLDLLAKGAFGRVSVGKGAAQISLYLRRGVLLAAASPDDLALILRRVRVRKALDAERVAELIGMNDLGEPVFGLLLDEVERKHLEPILRERFEDNIVRFFLAASQGDPRARFKQLDFIYVDNLQFVSDAAPTLETLARVAARAGTVRPEATVTAGRRKPSDALALALRALLTGPTAVADLLARADVEPTLGRAAVADLAAAGVLTLADAEEPASPSSPTAIPEDDDVTESVGPEPEVEEAPVDDLPPPTEDDSGLQGLSSLSAWMGQTELIADDELDAFADNEHDRGAGSEGGFRTDTHNLDKVEVAPEEPEVEDTLAADEAQASFSAPPLSEEIAAEKVAIANIDLQIIAAALDEVRGAGAGRAALQLLVDGPPARFQPLFRKLQVDDAGALPGDDLLDNLYTRPAAEHRALLGEGLVDLIERGLSAVGDELPDDSFDKMYEAVAGYRQKLIG